MAADPGTAASDSTTSESTTADITTREHDLRKEPPELLRDYYRQMTLVRTFELKASEMYQRAKIGGYCHLNLGEEATIVGGPAWVSLIRPRTVGVVITKAF